MAKATIYHSVDDDENKVYIDIKEMKKEYPNRDIEVVEFS